jgi:ABC-type multidrug transport system fused ATPase/permease subunit
MASARLLIGRGVDDIISNGNKTGLPGIVAALLLVYIASMFSMRFQMYFMSISGQKVLADLRCQVFERIQSLPSMYCRCWSLTRAA